MPNLVSGTSSGAENATLHEWKDFYGLLRGKQLAKERLLQDPLSYVNFRGQNVKAVFGYHRDGTTSNLVYFWSQGLSSLRIENLEKDSPEGALLKLASLLSDVCTIRPKFAQLRVIWEEKFASVTNFIYPNIDDIDLYWYDNEELTLACLFSKAQPELAVELGNQSSSSTLLECLAFHCDYFRMRSVLWNCAPMRYLNQILANEPTSLTKVHLETKLFKPDKANREDRFEWPWQRSIEHYSIKKGSVVEDCLNYSAIPTVSLVADLRKSTRVLEQMPREKVGEYSAFLANIVDIAKETVFKHGGFFDKETGDGIVGHFAEFPGLKGIEPASIRAFRAAEDIISNIQTECEKLQALLHLGVGGLGVSIGVHQQDAVWLAQDDQVRAIGPSVILASRLCDDADRNSIFVSNSLFQFLDSELPSTLVSNFSKKEYSRKEHDPNVGLYGYQIRLEEIV